MKNKEKMGIEKIHNTMALRNPQYESLKILDNIMRNYDLSKDIKELEKQFHEEYPKFKEFERNFPSFTFALATGVGKTILMGSFITYLYLNYGIKNFFVVAPNLTVYNKLIKDFRDPTFKKYLFKRIPEFTQKPPRIITGDNYGQRGSNQSSLEESVNINIFNIAKINSDIKTNKKEITPKIKRLNEYLGESYFDYLSGLTDLVLLMDESHHYRANKGVKVLNELDPILGLELTATPQVEKGTKTPTKFKNVLYEYSLARAIRDGFVKEPAVATRRDFDVAHYTKIEVDQIKLVDGIRIHRNVKKELEIYAYNEEKKIVKPFVLVVCRDITHSNEIKKYISSDLFYNGEYRDKVMELHSELKGDEKDENIQQLLSLENEENNIEIVIHVNMLKEGWDVTNLYTIIPLRTATSLTLREQTIGRGLRLPYGHRTGNKSVDTLNIVAHDNFNKVIEAANDSNSIIQKENVIVIEDDENYGKVIETVASTTKSEDKMAEREKSLSYARTEKKKNSIKKDIELTIKTENSISEIFLEYSKENITTDFLKNETVKKKLIAKLKNETNSIFQMELTDIEIEKKIEELVEERIVSVIDIPEITLITKGEQEVIYRDFDLDIKFLSCYDVPSEEIWIQNLQNSEHTILDNKENFTAEKTSENEILEEIVNIDPSIDYDKISDLLYNLIIQSKKVLSTNRTSDDVSKIITHHKKDIATNIIFQINEHKNLTPVEYEVKIINAVTALLSQKFTKFVDDEIVNYKEIVQAKDIKKKVIGEFCKACHNQYKFDSVPEHVFSVVLENSKSVKKWLRPAPGQFKIYWYGARKYEPDFVVETENSIYIVEIKGSDRLDDEEVKVKAKKAKEYCNNVNIAFKGNAKEWGYILLGENDFNRTSEFEGLIRKTRY